MFSVLMNYNITVIHSRKHMKYNLIFKFHMAHIQTSPNIILETFNKLNSNISELIFLAFEINYDFNLKVLSEHLIWKNYKQISYVNLIKIPS